MWVKCSKGSCGSFADPHHHGGYYFWTTHFYYISYKANLKMYFLFVFFIPNFTKSCKIVLVVVWLCQMLSILQTLAKHLGKFSIIPEGGDRNQLQLYLLSVCVNSHLSGLFSGVMWALATYCWFLASDFLGSVITFPTVCAVSSASVSPASRSWDQLVPITLHVPPHRPPDWHELMAQATSQDTQIQRW